MRIGWSGRSGPTIRVRATSSTSLAAIRRVYSSWAWVS
jgi:hypothetical protein